MDYKTIDYSKIVSPIALEFLLGGCESLMDTLPELYPDFIVNDESAVKKLIRGEYPAEDFSEQTSYNCYVFNSFCYFLTKDNLEFGGLFE